MRYFLNSYHPLVHTAYGRIASKVHDLPPFIDASIRREPDLEYKTPTISALCRGPMFAPRLKVSDVVVYLTIKGPWGLPGFRHRRLTAVLRVRRSFATHAEAAAWFRSTGLPLPSNCLVPGNPPEPLSHSEGLSRATTCGPRRRRKLCSDWDARYHERVAEHGTFHVCDCLYRSLGWSAPVVEDNHLFEAFGRVPGTRTPGTHPRRAITALLRSLGIGVRLPRSGMFRGS